MSVDEPEDFGWEVGEVSGDGWELIPEEIPRRKLPTSLRIIGVVAALSLLVIPVLNLINAGPRFADNGLEICRFDYCVVERHVFDEGLGPTMAVMSSIIIPDDEVLTVVDDMIEFVDGPAVTVEVVEELPGDLGGRYIPAERLIQLDRPVPLWVIAHEVAHTVASGHEDDFVATLVELARAFEQATQ